MSACGNNFLPIQRHKRLVFNFDHRKYSYQSKLDTFVLIIVLLRIPGLIPNLSHLPLEGVPLGTYLPYVLSKLRNLGISRPKLLHQQSDFLLKLYKEGTRC